ncbi:MAG: transposase [Thermodesulfobacteriota bacterium]|nr:transposase [Thermodesulfobacteriota bacterium]
MARPLRIQYEGAHYHVICRGDDRKAIFQDGRDREEIISILSDSLKIYSVNLYCYVLMGNHFHLFLNTPLGNLSEFMRQFNITYTSYYNRRHGRVGHLYQGRYKSILVDKDTYAVMLSRYIHLNPIRTEEFQNAEVRERVQYLKKYPWSSLSGYIDGRKRSSFIDYSLVLSAYGGDNREGRKAYWKVICEDLTSGIEIKNKVLAKSILGNDAFISWVRDRFLGGDSREIPAIKKIAACKTKDDILRAIKVETGMDINKIISSEGTMRQMAMEMLYREGRLRGTEIGKIFRVDYSTVSQGRKRLRDKAKKDKALASLIDKIEKRLSI